MINNKTSTKKCSGCAKEFTFKESISPHRKYCSKRCYLDASKWGVKKEEKTEDIMIEVKKKNLFERFIQFLQKLKGK